MARSCAVLLVLVSLAGCKTTEKRDDPVVRKLDVEGSKQVSDKELKKKILTTQTGWIPFVSKPQYFDPDVWRTDLRRIERYYRERGYYQAKVVSEEVTPVKNGVALKVRVEEGEPTRIGRVDVDGLDGLPEEHRRAVMDDFPLTQGEVFVETEWEGLKERILGTLRERGYAAADVEGIVQVDLNTRRADVVLHLKPGPRYRFGEVTVKQRPNARVESWRILEQAQASVHPGDWYQSSILGEAQGRVFSMGVFGAAKVRTGQPDPQSGTVPVEVDVQESPFHAIRAGFGLGIDQARNEARGVGQYADRDFGGGLRRLSVNGRAGWAFLPNAYSSVFAEVGAKNGPIADITAELTQPRLGQRDLSADLRLELQRGIEPAYSFFGGRAKVGLVWKPHPSVAIYPSYNLELYRLDEGEVSLGGTAPVLLFNCPTHCVLSYLEQRVEWDRRDDRQEPTRGYYLSLALQEGGGPLGGSFRYLRVQPEARYFVTILDEKLTLAAKVKLGALYPAGGEALDSPIVARFFSGGGNSMRGFGSRRLSPMAVVEAPRPKGEINAALIPVGGNGLFESSFEARYAVTGELVVAAFVDAGFVSPESLRASSFRDTLFAVGTGIRYRTPVGPIRLDLAYRPDVGPPLPIYQPSGTTLTYQTQTGCFGIGGGAPTAGSPEGPCSLHVSIGEAF